MNWTSSKLRCFVLQKDNIKKVNRQDFPGDSVVKNLAANAGAAGETDLIPWIRKIPRGEEQLYPCTTASEPLLWSPCSTTTEPICNNY